MSYLVRCSYPFDLIGFMVLVLYYLSMLSVKSYPSCLFVLSCPGFHLIRLVLSVLPCSSYRIRLTLPVLSFPSYLSGLSYPSCLTCPILSVFSCPSCLIFSPYPSCVTRHIVYVLSAMAPCFLVLISLTSHPHVITLKGLDDTIPTMPILLELAVCDAFEILENGHCHSWLQKTR